MCGCLCVAHVSLAMILFPMAAWIATSNSCLCDSVGGIVQRREMLLQSFITLNTLSFAMGLDERWRMDA